MRRIALAILFSILVRDARAALRDRPMREIIASQWVSSKTSGNLENLLSTATTMPCRIVIDEPWALTNALHFRTNQTLNITENGLFSGAYNVQIDGPVEAGLYRIFSPEVIFTNGTPLMTEVYPEWWGAVGDAWASDSWDTHTNATDDAVAIQKAIDFISQLTYNGKPAYGGGTLRLSRKYGCSGVSILAPTNGLCADAITILGGHGHNTYENESARLGGGLFAISNNQASLLTIGQDGMDAHRDDIVIKGVLFHGNDRLITNGLVHFRDASNIRMEDCAFKDSVGPAMKWTKLQDGVFNNIAVWQCSSSNYPGAILVSGSSDQAYGNNCIRIEQSRFQDCNRIVYWEDNTNAFAELVTFTDCKFEGGGVNRHYDDRTIAGNPQTWFDFHNCASRLKCRSWSFLDNWFEYHPGFGNVYGGATNDAFFTFMNSENMRVERNIFYGGVTNGVLTWNFYSIMPSINSGTSAGFRFRDNIFQQSIGSHTNVGFTSFNAGKTHVDVEFPNFGYFMGSYPPSGTISRRQPDGFISCHAMPPHEGENYVQYSNTNDPSLTPFAGSVAGISGSSWSKLADLFGTNSQQEAFNRFMSSEEIVRISVRVKVMDSTKDALAYIGQYGGGKLYPLWISRASTPIASRENWFWMDAFIDMKNVTNSLGSFFLENATSTDADQTWYFDGAVFDTIPRGEYGGYLDGCNPIYVNTNTVQIFAGDGYCNFKYFSIPTATNHDMTSLVAGDLSYIYIDDSGSTYPTNMVVIDSATAPSFNAYYQGWYNGDDRCIGAVLSSNAAAHIEKYFWSGDWQLCSSSGIRLSSDMNPGGVWDSPDDFETSDYLPVMADSAYINLYNSHSSATCIVAATTFEVASEITGAIAINTWTGALALDVGWGAARYTGPIDLGPSLKVWVGGQDDDDNTLNVWLLGWRLKR